MVVLTGSPYKNGTSNTLVNEFIWGTEEKKHTIERFDSPFLVFTHVLDATILEYQDHVCLMMICLKY